MSTQRWIRVDVGLPRNPKVLALAHDGEHQAALAYVFALCYCGEQGTAGFVPHYALTLIGARRADVRALISVGLFSECDGGYQINDWGVYQPSDDEMRARSERARRAAQARWSREREGEK